MAKRKHGRKGITRLIKAAFILAVAAVVGLVGWNYLLPMLTADSITLYDSYTAETGDVQTSLSFSATLGVKNSQTYTAGTMTKVKELYVASGDTVEAGDPLVLLNSGELLSAGFGGAVNEIRYGVGDWVRPNASLVQICDLVNLEVTMQVDEYDVKALTVGQPCTVSVISLGIDFETSIGHINRVSASSGTLAYYTVTCDVSVPEEVLPGMRATVSIPSQSAEDVTVLPLSALAFDEDENPYTLRLNADGAYEKLYVETGLSDGMRAEIRSGVNPGDTVYAADGTQSAGAGFSLADIYRAIMGENVVVNQMSGKMYDMAQMSDTMQLPADFNGQMPAGMNGDTPSGTGRQTPTDTDAVDDSSVSFNDLMESDDISLEYNP
ncbi:MAG: HlyD family efflux transporter periplasmic adaptor subunit [Clostridiales bacterium]|nr:HlyD family efflux transporter periplasmic adaptor subunit [Clostridiales bacterium]